MFLPYQPKNSTRARYANCIAVAPLEANGVTCPMSNWMFVDAFAFTSRVACMKVDVVLPELAAVTGTVIVALLSRSVKVIRVSGNVEDVVAACETTAYTVTR